MKTAEVWYDEFTARSLGTRGTEKNVEDTECGCIADIQADALAEPLAVLRLFVDGWYHKAKCQPEEAVARAEALLADAPAPEQQSFDTMEGLIEDLNQGDTSATADSETGANAPERTEPMTKEEIVQTLEAQRRARPSDEDEDDYEEKLGAEPGEAAQSRPELTPEIVRNGLLLAARDNSARSHRAVDRRATARSRRMGGSRRGQRL